MSMSRRSGLRFGGSALLAAGLVLAACGSDDEPSSDSGPAQSSSASTDAEPEDSASTDCTGTPIKYGLITNITASAAQASNEAVAEGAEAAANALTESCELGVPVEIVTCDDRVDPNAAAACGRELVDEGVIAFTGQSIFGSQWWPITSEAGIPEIGGFGFFPEEAASPMWFPLTDGATQTTLATVGAVPIAVNEMFGEDETARLAVVQLQAQGVEFLTNMIEQTIVANGGEFAGAITIPATATDMAPFAAEVVANGANAVYPILTGDQQTGLVKALAQQGTPLTDIAYMSSAAQTSCESIEQLGSDLDGEWLTSMTWPVQWDQSSPAAERFISELDAIGAPTEPCELKEGQLSAWAAVHIMADVMQGSTEMTAAALQERLETSPPIDGTEYGLTGTINWQENPYDGNDQYAGLGLDMLRVCCNQFYLSTVDGGVFELQSDLGLLSVNS